MAPSDRESNSFSTSRTSLIIVCFKIWLGPPFFSATWSMILSTLFFMSVSILTILAIGHWFQCQSSLSKIISPTANFWILFFHIFLTSYCRLWKNSILHLLQNSPAICCACCCLLFEHASGLLSSPGGGMTTLVFIVRTEGGCLVQVVFLFLSHWWSPQQVVLS